MEFRMKCHTFAAFEHHLQYVSLISTGIPLQNEPKPGRPRRGRRLELRARQSSRPYCGRTQPKLMAFQKALESQEVHDFPTISIDFP